MVRLSHAKFWNLICYQNHLQKGELLIHIFFIYQTLILSIGKITSTVDMFKNIVVDSSRLIAFYRKK